ncbi:hypothetical protein CC77DRAFT_199845 [Alternaria alternata]|uniref:Uncharacterized protein n=1 Tax=Alternaria alternata TaxID=5599 RepID=A0A177DH77_ALTAL|nr:hypothetical protein CC77DRAFT_199845 [Alternaria alternata]OAG18550.1 hypothetical protein CC77DRAFT_199845 [Alternaria alternata]
MVPHICEKDRIRKHIVTPSARLASQAPQCRYRNMSFESENSHIIIDLVHCR